jgi:hypothetical protein
MIGSDLDLLYVFCSIFHLLTCAILTKDFDKILVVGHNNGSIQKGIFLVHEQFKGRESHFTTVITANPFVL